MQKILCFMLIILALLLLPNCNAYAQNSVRFIYIHGTNDNNYKKKQEFTNDVKKLHQQLVVEFNNSELAKQYLLENGKYTISEKPIVFYWGAESKADLNLLSDWLDITKFFSPKIAQTVRTMIAHSFHDAIWIQKYNNMKPVINKLHKITTQIDENGDKYVLLGHSAGTFITYEYFLYKLQYIDTRNVFKNKLHSKETLRQIKQIGYRNTCVDALIDSGLVVYKRDNTFYVPTDNIIQKYKNLPKQEETSCALPRSTAGLINFGSPLSLFYSGFGENAEITTSGAMTYLLNHNVFLLNLNFAEDPLGFPIVSELDYSEALAYIEENHLYNNTLYGDKTNDINHGFIYDKSNIRSNKSVIRAHMAYWQKCKLFAKEVVAAYEEGLNTFVVNPDM